jgi:hypothetical protein
MMANTLHPLYFHPSKASPMMERASYPKILHFPPPTALKIGRIATPLIGISHDILEPTTRITFFNSGFKSDSTILTITILVTAS